MSVPETTAPLVPAPGQESGSNSKDDTAVWSLKHVQILWSWASRPKPAKPKYPPISSIPPTPASRLLEPDVAPTPFPTEPVRASDFQRDALAEKPKTVLYLAYGSNMAAETFLGMRGIRPLSQINVSAPSLDLTFDLPGVPYREPCFANTAMRKIPGKKPPFNPPEMPPPGGVLPGRPRPDDHEDGIPTANNKTRDPVWTKGLYGVVYEVTPDDYARIVATEGGGASYHEILVPCFALPPTIHVPEQQPTYPPTPFLAHTLYAPRLPPDSDSQSSSSSTWSFLPSFLRRLFLPARRPEGTHAQPSLRYLNLLRTGAREHDLPADYRAYLDALRPYRATTRRQKLGQVFFLGFWLPPLVSVMLGARVFADDKGKSPGWLVAASTALFNLIWTSYDLVGKRLFGDGERSVEEEDEESEKKKENGVGDGWEVVEGGKKARRGSFVSGLRGMEEVEDEEKMPLLSNGY
ncbi:hypothetical protein VTJ04DRAFT_1243 [Mycothermus thermophilus]|uniref:uncharacterized protein n=1 Tax=Humicola insolens TaxID=85995 RepID=UPI003742A586